MSGPYILIVAVFSDESGAGTVQKKLRQRKKKESIDLLDAAVLIKDEQNNIHVRDIQDLEMGRGAVFGALVGGMIGLLGGPLGVILGAAAGAATGGLTAHQLDMGFSDGAIKEIQASLHPSSSALVLIVNESQSGKVIEALEPYDVKLFQQRFLSDVVKQLKDESDG